MYYKIASNDPCIFGPLYSYSFVNVFLIYQSHSANQPSAFSRVREWFYRSIYFGRLFTTLCTHQIFQQLVFVSVTNHSLNLNLLQVHKYFHAVTKPFMLFIWQCPSNKPWERLASFASSLHGRIFQFCKAADPIFDNNVNLDSEFNTLIVSRLGHYFIRSLSLPSAIAIMNFGPLSSPRKLDAYFLSERVLTNVEATTTVVTTRWSTSEAMRLQINRAYTHFRSITTPSQSAACDPAVPAFPESCKNVHCF